MTPSQIDATILPTCRIREPTVDSTAIEVERISEANRFMAKLLAERVGTVNAVAAPSA